MSTAIVALTGAVGFLLGPLVRAAAFRHATEGPARTACPGCALTCLLAASGPYLGRCPNCGRRSGPAVLPELLTAGGFALAAAIGGPWIQLLALCWLAAFATALALVDAAVQRLPDKLTAPAFVGTALPLTAAALSTHDPAAALRLWLAAAALGAGYLVIALIAPLGLGDVKLATALGAALGYFSWHAALRGTIAAILLAGLYSAIMLLTGRAARRSEIALGPFMVLGAAIALVPYTR
jgi:leader peptidase (prepilin peptidase)/N-methyltransferase